MYNNGYPMMGGGFGAYGNPYGGYANQQQPQPKQTTTENVPEYTEEHQRLQRLFHKTEELYNRIMHYLMVWEQGSGMSRKNAHLMLQTLLPQLTNLIQTENNLISNSASMKKTVSEIKIKLSKSDDENSYVAGIAAEMVRTMADNRQSQGGSSSGMPMMYSGTPIAPTNYAGDAKGNTSVGQMLQSTQERIMKQQQDAQRAESGMEDVGKLGAMSKNIDMNQYMQQQTEQAPQVRYAVLANGNFVVVDQNNRTVDGYGAPPATRIEKWFRRNGRSYGIGDDGCEYEVVG